jgi:hypothetical protein
VVAESEIAVVLERLLADPEEMDRVIDALSWGQEPPLGDLLPRDREAVKAFLTRWLLARAGYRERPCAGSGAALTLAARSW